MPTAKKIRLYYLIIGGFFLFLDQFCKYLANIYLQNGVYLIKPWLGLEFFKNSGIAFSLPVPNIIIIFLTVIILFALAVIFKQNLLKAVNNRDIIFIYCGALSNLCDRLFHGYTVDYIRIIYSVINLADVIIVVGIIFLLIDRKILQKK